MSKTADDIIPYIKFYPIMQDDMSLNRVQQCLLMFTFRAKSKSTIVTRRIRKAYLSGCLVFSPHEDIELVMPIKRQQAICSMLHIINSAFTKRARVTEYSFRVDEDTVEFIDQGASQSKGGR